MSYEAIINAIPDLIFIITSKGFITDFRQTQSSLPLLIPKENIIGSHINELPLNPMHIENIMDSIQRVIKEGSVRSVEYAVDLKDSVRYFEARLAKAGEDEALALVRDYTDVINAQMSLRESEEKFRLLTAKASDGIFLVDEHGRITLWNESCAKIFGYSQNEAIGKDFHKILFPAIKSEESTVYDKKHNSTWKFEQLIETIAVNKKGELFPIEISTSKVVISGRAHYLKIVRDISTRKEKEEYLKQTIKKSTKFNEALSNLFFFRNDDFEKLFKHILKVDAEVLNINRVSIWFLNSDCSKLECNLLYIKNGKNYFKGGELILKELPEYYERIKRERTIPLVDARNSYMFRNILNYFEDNNIFSTLDAPIRVSDKVIGVICHESTGESREWDSLEINFAASIADRIAIEIEAKQRSVVRYPVVENSSISVKQGLEDGNIAELLNNLLEYYTHSHELFFTIGNTGIIDYTSPNVDKALGYTVDELRGALFNSLLTEESNTKFGKYLKLMNNPYEACPEELKIILKTKDSIELPFAVNCVAIRDTEGKLLRIHAKLALIGNH